MSEIQNDIEIPGLPGKYIEILNKYDYEKDGTKCPACDGVGVPWGGWFSCYDCKCKAVVDDGRAFLPKKER